MQVDGAGLAFRFLVDVNLARASSWSEDLVAERLGVVGSNGAVDAWPDLTLSGKDQVSGTTMKT